MFTPSSNLKVPVAYLSVVVIWSTTPLGIVWSSETVSPTMAVLLRMAIAVIIGTLLLLIARIKLPLSKPAIRLYSYSALGIFGGMLCSYMAARSIGSGLISLIFGLSPVVSGLLAQKILNEPKFSPVRLAAFIISLTGLGIVCWHKIGDGDLVGISFIVAAMIFFSLSAVMVKSVSINIHPLATTIGALYFSIPLFVLAWWLLDGNMNSEQWSNRSIGAIIYLGIFGSLIGFIAYFFVLQKLSASTASLITLITPVFAIMLGVTLNGEHLSYNLIVGAIFVMSGLCLYHRGEKWLRK